MSQNLAVSILLIITGLAIIGSGIWAQKGYSRGMYLFKGFPGHPSGYIYASYPAGILCLLIAFALFVQDLKLAGEIVGYGSWIIIILSIILMAWKPRWLKPWWLKWLEDHYSGAILEVILEEARQSKDFEDQTPDEVSLSAWVHTALERYKSQSQS